MKIKINSVYHNETIGIEAIQFKFSCDIQSQKLIKPGEYYLESAVYGSAAQNRFFHLLITEYFNSGCYSDNVANLDELKINIKIRLGQGIKLCSIPGVSVLKSWSDYTKKQRRECINNLIQEMDTVGAISKRVQDILNEFEWGT